MVDVARYSSPVFFPLRLASVQATLTAGMFLLRLPSAWKSNKRRIPQAGSAGMQNYSRHRHGREGINWLVVMQWERHIYYRSSNRPGSTYI